MNRTYREHNISILEFRSHSVFVDNKTYDMEVNEKDEEWQPIGKFIRDP